MTANINRNVFVITGMLCAAVAVFAMGYYIDRQSAKQQKMLVDNIAGIILAQAETAIDDATKAADSIKDRKMTSCTKAVRSEFRSLSFNYPAIYEIGLFNSKGQVLCSNMENSMYSIAGSKNIGHENKHKLHLMKLDHLSGAKVLMVNLKRSDGDAIRVIISPRALFNGFLQKDLRKFGHASISMNNGVVINETGELWNNKSREGVGEVVSVTRRSENHLLSVRVEILAKALPGNSLALLLFVYLGGAFFTVLIGLMIATLSKREESMYSEISAGILRNEFIPYYQPIINSKTGTIAGCEVLVRWHKSGGEIVPPDMFIPYMEMNGQIIEVTHGLMCLVRDEMANFQRDNSGFFYSINLTAQHLTSSDVLDDVKEIFATSIIEPSDLVFEITERQPLHDIDAAGLIIEGLQSIGCEVALDDAGTGHGGLAYIQHLGVDKIKIDKMFVEAIEKGSLGAPIVDALINMSRELGISVVAEGVETEAQLNYLCAHGAEFLQGYIFAPPMPKATFIQFYHAYHREIVNIRPQKPAKQTPALLKTIAAAAA